MSNEVKTKQPRTRKARRLGRSLLNTFFLLVFVPAVLLTGVSAVLNRQDARAHAVDQMETLAIAQEQAISDWFTDVEETLRLSVSSPLLQASVDQLTSGLEDDALVSSEFSNYTKVLTESGSPFDQITLADSDGIVRGSSEPALLNANFSNEPWFREAHQSIPFTVVVTGPYRDPIDGVDGFYFSVAIHRMGREVGVLLGRVNMHKLAEEVAAAPALKLGETGDAFLVNSGQQYVTRPRFYNADLLVADDEIIPNLLSGNNGSGTWIDYRGQHVVGAYHWIETANLGLVVKQDLDEALAGSKKVIGLNFLLGGLLSVGVIAISFFFVHRFTSPLEQLIYAASGVSQGNLDLKIPGSWVVEFQGLADSLNQLTSRVQTLLSERDEMIKTRARQFEITAQIGRMIAAERDFDHLLDLTVNAICEQLEHYHAQIFLLDDLRQNAVLRASTGDTGKKLLARGHKLAVGSKSVIGQVTESGEAVLASDTRHADFWLPNPLLPATRSELAIPVRLGGRILGALDVQSTEPDVFDEETIVALQTVADQLAVAINNAQLFNEKEGLLSASVQLTQTLTRESWESYISQRESDRLVGFQYDLTEVKPVSPEPGGSDNNGHDILLPIALRDQVIGSLQAQQPEGVVWSDEDKNLVGQVLDRVALALENARLFEQTQLSLKETNRLYRASQQIAAANDINALAEELIDFLRTENVDRVLVYMLDNPDVQPGERWVEILAKWLRDPDDLLMTLPRQLQTGKPPLTMLEDVPSDGMVINDIATADIPAEAKSGFDQIQAKAVAIFPMVVARRTIGWFELQNTSHAGVFRESDVRFYQTLADQAATALAGNRLLEQTRMRARRLQATNEVSKAVSSILNPDILLPRIVDQIGTAFDYYHVQIFLIDELGEWAVLRASTGEIGQELLNRNHRLMVGSQSVIGQVTEHGNLVIAYDTDVDLVHRRNELLPNTRSEMAIPLKTGDRVIGALDVQSTHPNAFDEEAQVILQSMADEIAVTLENAQLFQEIQDRVAELTTINLVSQAVSRAETLEDLFEVVTVQLMRTFGTQHGYLGMVNDDGMIELPIFIENGERIESPPPQLAGEGLSGYVINTKQTLLINENLEEEAKRLGARVVRTMPKSALMVPLQIGDEVMGVISLMDVAQEHAYDESHVRQLSTLAAYIAIKIHNAELLEEAQRQAAELGFLFNTTSVAVGTTDLDAALEDVASILFNEISGAEASVIYLISEDDQYLEPHAAVGYGREIAARGTRLAVDEGMFGMATETGRAQIVDDTHMSSRVNGGAGRTRSAIVVPLITGGQIIGAITVESSRPRQFTERQQQLLEAVANTLTAIIENVRLLERIQQAHEELRELDRLKTQFLANMSHELRTPLNSIIGFSRVMLKEITGPLNDSQAHDLSIIHSSGRHLLGLINDILDMSKIEAGKMEINPEYISMVEIIDGVMASGQGLIDEKPVQIFKEIEESLPPVYGDPTRVRQVLLNLVSNAAKFTAEGSITIRARYFGYDPESHQPPRVQVEVQDTGIGVAEEDMDKLFEAFQQVDGSTTRAVGGTGLGLPISKNFVEMHGGRMWVESVVGTGSTFLFTIPTQPQSSAEVIYDLRDKEERPIIMVVDVETRNLDLYKRFLDKEGLALLGLNSANNLFDHVKEADPAVIVFDVNLPEGNGWEIAAQLKQDKDTRHIPLIICSLEEDQERANKLGISGYLVKPVSGSRFLEEVKEAQDGAQGPYHNVLLIDADTDYAQSLKETLENTGRYVVRVNDRGYEGLQSIYDQKPDLLILDPNLPFMDGITGLLAPMITKPELQDIPVMLLTTKEVSERDIERFSAYNIRFFNKQTTQNDDLLQELTAMMGQD